MLVKDNQVWEFSGEHSKEGLLDFLNNYKDSNLVINDFEEYALQYLGLRISWTQLIARKAE